MKCFHIFMNFYAASFPKKNYFMKGTTFFIYSTWRILSVSESSVKIKVGSYCPVDTDVFKTSLGRLKRSQHLVTKQDLVTTSGKRLRIYNVLKTPDLRHLEDVQFTTSWRRLIYDVFRTSGLWCPEDVWFTLSWRRQICDFLKTFDLRCLEDVRFMTPLRRL